MDDLISRAAAIETFTGKPPEYYHTSYIVGELNCAPAVDAVPIVRCMDCEHSYFASNRAPDEQCWTCWKHGIDVTTDWFCADGERGDDDGKDS